jgi:hypothetical protein
MKKKCSKERHFIWGDGKKHFLISGFKGSQAVPVRPSGRGMFERGWRLGSQKVWRLKERSWVGIKSLKSKSKLLYDWRFTADQFVFASSPLRLTTNIYFFRLNTCGHSPYVTFSLTRRWVYRLQLLLVLASSVILGSESRGTHDHILLSQIRDSPNLGGQVHVFISPGTKFLLNGI